MKQERHEEVTLRLESGVIGIRHAKCPSGCDLMDPSTLIHDLPAIKVSYEAEGREGIAYLDPVYGRFDNIHEWEPADGTVVEFSCSSCGGSLRGEETCQTCAGPLFELQLPRGIVEGCQRKGCRYHRLTIVDTDTLMARLFTDNDLDSYL
jgi:hypothetical protein